MEIPIAEDQKQFVSELVRSGQFGDEAAVVREAIRRMQSAQGDYLNPPPLTSEQLEEIYRKTTPEEEEEERRIGRAVFSSLQAAVRRGSAC